MSTAQSLQQSWPLPKNPIPIAMIGAGGIVNDAHMPAYGKAGFQVVGIFDENAQRAQLTAERWKIARVWTSLDEVIADTAARNVIFDVAIPPTATLSLLERLPAAASVLMQKPMGVDLEQARAIVDCCRRKRLVAAVNHQLRFAPYMLAVRDAFQRGWLGAMTDIEMQLNACDPWHLFPFLEPMERVEIQVHSIHYLDLIRSLLGEPAGVYALTIPDARFPKLKSTRSSIILNYGCATRVCLSLNHNYAHGSHRRSVPKQPMWQLGPKVIALAAQAGSWAIMRRRAKVAMEEFVQSGGPTVHLGIRDGNEVVYIDKAESLKFATIASAVGQRRPLNVTALGKCLVAFDANADLAQDLADAGLVGRTQNSITDRNRWVAEIAEVRKSGIAHDVEECDVGACCVAAPICDSQGYAVAAISISALSIDRAQNDSDRLERKIRQLAGVIST